MKRAIIIFVAVVLLVGCDQAVLPADPYEGMGTPGNTLAKFEMTFVEANKDKSRGKEFMSLFSDDFVFYFDEDDVGVSWPGYEIPEYWELSDFLITITSIFTNSPQYSMEVGEEYIGDVPEGSTDFESAKIWFEGRMYVDEYDGVTAPSGLVSFGFTRLDTEYGVRWVITEWRDFTNDYSSGGGRRPWTLGESFAYFYAISKES
jgi:hypothetical protein